MYPVWSGDNRIYQYNIDLSRPIQPSTGLSFVLEPLGVLNTEISLPPLAIPSVAMDFRATYT